MIINYILNNCNNRYQSIDIQQCQNCSYGKNCPRDCEKCLEYIHFPTHAPSNVPQRKYDCPHMADYYTCKYACRYTSEVMYAIEKCKDLKRLQTIKVLSFGCGPCTDLFAIDTLKNKGILHYDEIEYRGIDYSKEVWNLIHNDIKSLQKQNNCYKFFYRNACDMINRIAKGKWTPNLIVFQYVFSDMKKNSSNKEIEDFINTFADYFNTKINPNTYIIINDVNLSCSYGGGREYFDTLQKRLVDVISQKGYFHNNSKEREFIYGEKFPDNSNKFDLAPWKFYSPFNTCASAQMIIKKVKESDYKC